MSERKTISDSKGFFHNEFPYVIPAIYRKVTDELLVELNLLSHQKESVRFLANLTIFNTESVSGKNLKRIKLDTNGNILQSSKHEIKESFPNVYTLPQDEKWKPVVIKEISEILKGHTTLDNCGEYFSNNELTEMLTTLCCG